MQGFEQGPGRAARRRQLELRRARSLKSAQLLLVMGTAGVVFLCVRGLHPPALAIPVFLAVVSVIFAAASAGMFALAAQLQLADADEDVGDDRGGPGGGSDDLPKPPRPMGGPAFDWERFEQEFRVYCERATVVTR